MIISLIAELTLMCSNRISRKVPINYILLLIITIGQSYMLSLISAQYDPELVFTVFLISSTSFLGMSFYAYSTSQDLTITGSMTWGISLCMLTLSFFFIFTGINQLGFLIYSGLGVIFTLFFVAIDT